MFRRRNDSELSIDRFWQRSYVNKAGELLRALEEGKFLSAPSSSDGNVHLATWWRNHYDFQRKVRFLTLFCRQGWGTVTVFRGR